MMQRILRDYRGIIIFIGCYYAVYGVLAAFVEPFTWFGGSDALEKIGIPAHIALFAIPLLVTLVYYIATYQERLLRERFLGLASVSSGKRRVDSFQDLRDRAQSHIVVMGIGMSHIAQFDLPSLSKQGESVSIDFLMLDPDFLESDKAFAKRLEEFLDITEFSKRVRASFKKLKEFCEDWNENDKNRHKMSLKVYKTIPTNSMTIIDPDEDTGEVIVEFFLYQSGAYRPRLQIKKVDHRDGLFNRIYTEHSKLWNSARRIV